MDFGLNGGSDDNVRGRFTTKSDGGNGLIKDEYPING